MFRYPLIYNFIDLISSEVFIFRFSAGDEEFPMFSSFQLYDTSGNHDSNLQTPSNNLG